MAHALADQPDARSDRDPRHQEQRPDGGLAEQGVKTEIDVDAAASSRRAPPVRREDAVRAHGEAFAGIAPANTTYVVAGFIPDVLVEVELDAIVPDAT